MKKAARTKNRQHNVGATAREGKTLSDCPIRRFRQEMLWTLEEMGRRVGVSKTAVKMWESGMIMPSEENLQILADLARKARYPLMKKAMREFYYARRGL